MRFPAWVLVWLCHWSLGVQVAAAAAAAAAATTGEMSEAILAVEDCYHAHSLRGYHHHVVAPPIVPTVKVSTTTTTHHAGPQTSKGHAQQLDRTKAARRTSFVANSPH
jgi:hypothetical protein